MNRLSSLLRLIFARRTISIVVLAVLIAAMVVYFVGTSDENVRAMAERYLTEATGGEVSVESASFDLFGPISLRGVNIATQSNGGHTVITADVVSIEHRPWSLFWGRLEPTDVLCVRPIVTIDNTALAKNVSQPTSAESRPAGVSLPAGISLRLRDGLVRLAYRDEAGTRSVSELSVNATAMPLTDGYRMLFGPEGAGGFYGSVEIACHHTELRDLDVAANVQLVISMLSPDLRQELSEYNLKGLVRVKQGPSTPDGPTLAIFTEALSARLPESLGNVEVQDMAGRAVVVPGSRLWISQPFTARVPQLGRQLLEIRGFVEGFGEGGHYRFTASMHDCSIPEEDIGGEIGRVLGDIETSFRPRGSFDATACIERKPGDNEEMRIYGSVMPLGGDATFEGFPYRVGGLEGTVDWTPDKIERFYLTGRRGDSLVTIRGSTADYYEDGALDVFVEAKDVTFNDELRQALPDNVHKVWPMLRPTGQGTAVTRVSRATRGGELEVDVTVALDGRAGMTYEEFPYQLDEVSGKVRVMGDRVLIDAAGKHGDTQIALQGWLVDLDVDDSRAELHIDISDLKVDEDFKAALDDGARASLEDLQLKGVISSAKVLVVQAGDAEAQYTVDAELKDCFVKPAAFDYSIDSLSGSVEITPQVVTLKGLAGRHGTASGVVTGRIVSGGEGEESTIESLAIKAKSVALDDDLREALPAAVQKVWDDISPVGTVDIDVNLREIASQAKAAGSENERGDDESLDYEVTIKPVGATITYAEFPLPLTCSAGSIVAVPGHVDLKGLIASGEGGNVELSGRIETGLDAPTLLVLRTKDLKVSKKLISAASSFAPQLANRISPGGTVGLEPVRLVFRRVALPVATAASGPASAPAGNTTTATSQPTSAPSRVVQWRAEGAFVFSDVPLDLGLSSKTLSGRIWGYAAGPQLDIDAGMTLASVKVGGRQITDLTGRIHKKPTSDLILLRRLEAKAYGGAVDGKAFIKLNEPSIIRADLRVMETDLAKLVNAGVTAPAKRSEIKGILDGDMWMEVGLDGKANRSGAGRLRISRGRLKRLPVVLELLHLVQLQLPGNTAFTTADVQYYVKGDIVTFSQIQLDSEVLSLIGSGWMNIKSRQLRLTFAAGTPGRLPHLSQSADVVLRRLSELLVMLGGKLVTTEVTGTIDKPVMNTVPLPSLSLLPDLIKRLMHPDDEIME